MKSILISIRLYYFYCTYKGIKTEEIRKKFPFNYKGKIYEYVSKTNWKQDLMKIPADEREFFKQFVGKVGLCFECDKVEDVACEMLSNGVGFDAYFFTNTYNDIRKASCLNTQVLINYLGAKPNGAIVGKAIPISKLEIFDKPKELSEFKTLKSIEQYKKDIEESRKEDLEIHERIIRDIENCGETTWAANNEELTEYCYNLGCYGLQRAPQSRQYIEVEE